MVLCLLFSPLSPSEIITKLEIYKEDQGKKKKSN